MADSSTSREESLSMYRYLCDNVIGSEDIVTTRKKLINALDNLTKDTIITSGSFGEGLEMRGSDFDVMCRIRHVKVYEDIQSIPSESTEASLVMEMENVKTGFTKLRLVVCNNNEQFQFCEQEGHMWYLSSGLVKSKLIDPEHLIIHGPCFSDKKENFDITICFQMTKWIHLAHPWMSRTNGSWPVNKVKSAIVEHGVLLVPIGVKGSLHEDLEWRISFSVGEKFLIHSFCHTQLLCYALMKILLKDVISVIPECKDLLCSFHIKNIIFWICEERSSNFWTPDNLLPCFMECFKRLVYCVEYSVCPHYFIPENNLFENKIEGNNRMLLNVLNSLYHQGWQCILDSNQFSKRQLDSRQIMNHIKCKVSATPTLSSLLHRLCVPLHISNNFHEELISKILSSVSSRTRAYYLHCLSSFLCDAIQHISVNSIDENKSQYRQYRTCIAYLLQSIYHDVATGWLMLASVFYQTKQYKKSLNILSYVIAKITPETIYRRNRLLHIQWMLLSPKSIRDVRKFHIQKVINVQTLAFLKHSTLIPKELVLHSNIHFMEPIVFCHFVSLLCHYKLKDVRKFRISAINYLGVAKMLHEGLDGTNQTLFIP